MENKIPVSKEIFGTDDVASLISKKNFSEADVAAVIVEPILKNLGFSHENIERNKTLKLRAGHKQHEIRPDYLIKIENSYAWVLETKTPEQNVLAAENIEQAHSYAAHININSIYFALCNGFDFACFRTTKTDLPLMMFKINEIDKYWNELENILSVNSFQSGRTFTYQTIKTVENPEKIEYMKRPLLGEIPVKKREAKRHFGVHGYFTRQSWNVVSDYIKHFSNEGDTVLDPFGGSGVTAIEALVNNRKAVSVDINPMAVFLINSLLAPVDFNHFESAYNRICREYTGNEPKTKEEREAVLEKYSGPKELLLPKSSDVQTVPELFSRKQLAQLALLKGLIKKEKDKNIRETLMLMFSGMVTRINLTYHVSDAVTAGTGFGGDAAAFRYYRYRLAKNSTEINLIKCFDIRYKKILAAKKEIELNYTVNSHKDIDTIIQNIQNLKGNAADLSFLQNESVDYIYTDPPYGKKIPYLDLSVMWNAWLDLEVTEKDYENEAIEGGEHHKTKEKYNELMAKSIKEMYRVLKFDRWLSFVYAHKDPEFWHLIIDTCEKCGFEYAGAVPQKNGQTSFKKRQHPFTVLSGQLILNFKKTKNPRVLLKKVFDTNVEDLIMQTVEGTIAKNHGATLEQINDELIIKGLEHGFLHLLQKHYSDLSPVLLESFDYNNETEKFNLKKNKPFKTFIDEELRIRYFLRSFLLNEGTADFDSIVMVIMPLLKNGKTPENQTILSVLQDIAEKTEKGWKLKQKEKKQLEFL